MVLIQSLSPPNVGKRESEYLTSLQSRATGNYLNLTSNHLGQACTLLKEIGKSPMEWNLARIERTISWNSIGRYPSCRRESLLIRPSVCKEDTPLWSNTVLAPSARYLRCIRQLCFQLWNPRRTRCCQLPRRSRRCPRKQKGILHHCRHRRTSRRVDYVADALGFRATVKTNEPGTAASAPAAALVASPYAGPVAPVVNHVAPAAAVVGHAATYAAPLAVAAPAVAAPVAVAAPAIAAPVAYGGVIAHGAALAAPVAYGGVLGHGLGLAAPLGLGYGLGYGKALIH
ncbi:hypothetical protein HNY73_007135 [Argiope bruennichi]|uniref:Uncharacterized protein n=1 Tax=Argiope bruennichi TaxID=94029 RepID=A0A8T0FK15_ARGBR|nr:hypothetical protein HNY73_007135 [Argiope bruennichi]